MDISYTLPNSDGCNINYITNSNISITLTSLVSKFINAQNLSYYWYIETFFYQ